jgi:hypothetical protein
MKRILVVLSSMSMIAHVAYGVFTTLLLLGVCHLQIAMANLVKLRLVP